MGIIFHLFRLFIIAQPAVLLFNLVVGGVCVRVGLVVGGVCVRVGLVVAGVCVVSDLS